MIRPIATDIPPIGVQLGVQQMWQKILDLATRLNILEEEANKPALSVKVDDTDYLTMKDLKGFNHNLLSNLTVGDPHTQYALLTSVHARQHNLLTVADHADVATYLNQALLIASSPTFANLNIPSGGYVGLAAGTGRMVITDAATDNVTFMNCVVGVGATPGTNTQFVVNNTANARQIIQAIGTSYDASLVLSQDATPTDCATIKRYGSAHGTVAKRNALEISTDSNYGKILLSPSGGGVIEMGCSAGSFWMYLNRSSSIVQSIEAIGATLSTTIRLSEDAVYSKFASLVRYGSNWSAAALRSAIQLITNDNGNIHLTPGTGFVAIGTFGTLVPSNLLEMLRAATDCDFQMDCYSDTAAHKNVIKFLRSGSDTIGTAARTLDTYVLGCISAYGYNATPTVRECAQIQFKQNGATDTYVPGNIVFSTSSDTVDLAEIMRITTTGIGIFNNAPACALCVTGGVSIGDNTATASGSLRVAGAINVVGMITIGDVLTTNAGTDNWKFLGLTEVAALSPPGAAQIIDPDKYLSVIHNGTTYRLALAKDTP